MSKWILVVDDNSVSRDLLAELLEVDYEIINAKNGIEALSILSFQLGKVEAVLLDLMMPQMDGFEFLKQFNSKGWDKKVPVIVVSSNDDEVNRERCAELGIKFFLKKPYTFKEASIVINSAIADFKKDEKS